MWLKAIKHLSEKLEGIKEITQAFPDPDEVACA
jgi:hypothetical protein